MNISKKHYRVVLAITIVLNIVGCGNESNEIGLWKSASGEGSVEFEKNGAFTMVDNSSGTIAGNYRIENNNTIVMEATATDILSDGLRKTDTVVIESSISINGDQLTLRDPNGSETLTYMKVH